MNALQKNWQDFSSKKIAEYLNPPCATSNIEAAENDLGFALPKELTQLLVLNNGQKLEAEGIFKNISGWDIYNKLKFLDCNSIVWAYKEILNDEDLLGEFGLDLIPFATKGGKDFLGDTYAINIHTGEIFILWTEAADWTLPKEWQFGIFKRGDSLIDFIKLQTMLFN